MVQVSNARFFEMVTEQINVANTHIPESEPGVAGAALMHAAARFNAFVSATQFVNGRIMLENKAEHIDHYVALYREYLEDHFKEYAENFSQHQRPSKAGG